MIMGIMVTVLSARYFCNTDTSTVLRAPAKRTKFRVFRHFQSGEDDDLVGAVDVPQPLIT